MKKNLFCFIAALLSISATAQTNQQLMAVNQFSNLSAMNAVSSPSSGSLAYNLDNNSLYYFDGTTWVPSSSGWKLNGNDISSSHFLGSTNNEPIRFRVNNVEEIKIENKGRLVTYNSVYIGNLNGENETNTATGFNIGIGSAALQDVTSGPHNIAIGMLSLGDVTDGNYNTAIGVNTIRSSLGDKNTALGARAYYLGNYSNSTAIGCQVSITASNQVRIGNAVSSIGGPQSWSQTSDKRFKENVKENVVGLDFIMGLKPVTYNINFKALEYHHTKGLEDTTTSTNHYKALYDDVQIGFLAQDVEALADSLNFDFHGIDKPENQEGSYALRYSEFVAPIVKAMQEQQAIIKSLQERIESLEKNK